MQEGVFKDTYNGLSNAARNWRGGVKGMKNAYKAGKFASQLDDARNNYKSAIDFYSNNGLNIGDNNIEYDRLNVGGRTTPGVDIRYGMANQYTAGGHGRTTGDATDGIWSNIDDVRNAHNRRNPISQKSMPSNREVNYTPKQLPTTQPSQSTPNTVEQKALSDIEKLEQGLDALKRVSAKFEPRKRGRMMGIIKQVQNALDAMNTVTIHIDPEMTEVAMPELVSESIIKDVRRQLKRLTRQ